jgi:hypothetical protein
MRRIVWFGVGVAVTVIVYRKGRKVMQRYVPSAVADRAQQAALDAGERAQGFVAQFRETFAEASARREAELMGALLAEGTPDPQDTRATRAHRRAQRHGYGAPYGAPTSAGPSGTVDANFDDDEADLGYSF